MSRLCKISNSLLKGFCSRRPLNLSSYSTCPCKSTPKISEKPEPDKLKAHMELCAPNLLMDPKCKSAVITGGISGIGLAAASHFLQVGGRQIVVMGTNCCRGKEAETFLNKNYGRNKATFMKVNLNELKQIEESFKEAYKFLNGIDVVVNAAGILDGANWEKEVATNIIGTIRGTLLGFKYAGKEGKGHGGIIVNIAGIYGLDPLPEAPTFSACQHAIVGFSRSFGNKLHEARSGIRVVTLCPGFTKTKLLCDLEKKGMTEVMGRKLQKKIEKAKLQKRDACGEAILHLVKYAATGTLWIVDGSRLFFVDPPKRDKSCKLIAQFL